MPARKLAPAIYTVSYRDAAGSVLTEPQAPYTMPWDPVTQSRRFVGLLSLSLYERGNHDKRRRVLDSIARLYEAGRKFVPLALPESVASVLVTSSQGYRADYRITQLPWEPVAFRMPDAMPPQLATLNAAYEEDGRGPNYYDPAVIADYAGQSFPAEWAPDPFDVRFRLVRFCEPLPPVSNPHDPRAGAEKERIAAAVGRMLVRSAWPTTVGYRLCGSNLRYALATLGEPRTYPAEPAGAAANAGKGRRR